MTRLALPLSNGYPRARIWWMECDVCHETRSDPAWSEHDLPLERFTAEGWRCQPLDQHGLRFTIPDPLDTCPICLTREKDPR